MAILRKAFVKVAPDTSTFDKELKDKLKKTDTKPEGDKVGKEFSSSLTRRIDRELKAFDLPKLELKGDPKDAIKAIESTSRKLEELRDDADNIELRLQANKALGDLGRFRKTLGDFGPDLGTTLGVSTSQGFFASLSTSFKAPPAAVGVGAGVLAAALAPTLAAGISGAVVGGVGVGGVIGGVLLAARDDRVKAAGADLGAFIVGDLEGRAADFVPAVLGGIDDIRAGWRDLGPDLDRIFGSSRFVDPLVAGAVSGGRKLIAGLADAVDKADPVIGAFAAAMDRVGDAAGDVFSTLAEDADEGASAIDDMSLAVSNFIRVSGGIIHAGAAVKGYSDSLDVALDKGRYWLEDLRQIGPALDLTADGFAYGSKEAEAFRKATIGTAEAADFATLKAAGLTDAEIAGADASGTYMSRLDEVNGVLGDAATYYTDTTTAADKLNERTALLGEVQSVAGQQMDALLTRTGAVTGAMDAQRAMADLLRDAHEKMYGAAINASEANEGYEASWDNLSGAVEKNGRSLSDQNAKGRNNRDMLQALLKSTGELFYAEIETGTSIEGATKKHEDRIKAVKEEARRLGLNKVETQKLIDTYGQIPPKKGTDLFLDGFKEIGKALTDLYIFQRSLATGRTLAQVRSDLFGGYAGSPRAFKATGGEITGPGTGTSDSVPIWASSGEHMWTAREVQAAGGHGAMMELRRAALDGAFAGAAKHATGGAIGQLAGKNWGDRMRYPIDLTETHVMSKSDAAKRVVAAPPAGGATAPWMVALIKQAFPALSLISGYRPGATTLSGGQSYHALNRAVDYAPSRELARYMYQNYKGRLKEAITPFPQYNVLNGRDHTFTGAVWRQHNWSGGNAHDHFAMANGGVIPEPVFGVGASGRTYSFAERGPETVVPNGGAMRIHPADIAALAAAQSSPTVNLYDTRATVAEVEAALHRQALRARFGRSR
ncbi:hypothetical protein M2302_001047 [Micromonospora sp. A200]|uniref:hypothetical protein n=1 Tax=Micromonospora sp. A200 TaxID=2940568 RepID=UPI002477294B|nr:hypothetical protein [Micromonospora sp. A200]MDH6460881.1 hypothetical protein [Micromonospora sp. A200]